MDYHQFARSLVSVWLPALQVQAGPFICDWQTVKLARIHLFSPLSQFLSFFSPSFCHRVMLAKLFDQRLALGTLTISVISITRNNKPITLRAF